MTDQFKALIIGIVEGLTEFLPVSSTAHIRISQELLSIPKEDAYWKMFAIVIQLGAILSVLVYFRKRILGFLASFPSGKSGKAKWFLHPLSLVIISFVVTAIPCYLMDETIGERLEQLQFIGWALIVGGAVMWIVDRYYSRRAKTQSMEEMSLSQAIVIGCAQILAATFPGVSRSMSTIAAGQMMGLTRPAALEFSFFLSIPVMISATAFKLLQFVLKNDAHVTTIQWQTLAIGFVVSFFVALAGVAGFIAWVNKHGFAPFAIYRFMAGACVLYWLT